jgi:hypothetical protein
MLVVMTEKISQAMRWLKTANFEEVVGDIDHIIAFAYGKVKGFVLNVGYWVGVGVVGIALSAVVMQVSGIGLESVMAQSDPLTDATDAVQTIVGDYVIIAYIMPLIILPYMILGGITMVLGYILQIIIGYPWSPFWTGFNAASGFSESVAGGAGSLLGASNYSSGGFINIATVIAGWRAVRDICNLFFSIILLIIALATVLNLEAYKWQDLLKKLIIYAVLINFSRTIAGVFTDAATVIMATFGAAVGNNIVGGIVGNLGLATLGQLQSGIDYAGNAVGVDPVDTSNNEQEMAKAGAVELIASLLIGMGALFIASFVLTAFIVILVLRIVLLWFLIILSPLAYVTRILPFTLKYSSEWWQKFGQYVIVGPLISFFLWLTIFILNGGSLPGGPVATLGGGASAQNETLGAGANLLQDGLSKVDDPNLKGLHDVNYSGAGNVANVQTPSFISNFILVTIALLASLQFSMRMAGEAASLAGQASQFMKDTAVPQALQRSSRWVGNKLATFGMTTVKDKDGNDVKVDNYTEEKGALWKRNLRDNAVMLANTAWNTPSFIQGHMDRFKQIEEKRAQASDDSFNAFIEDRGRTRGATDQDALDRRNAGRAQLLVPSLLVQEIADKGMGYVLRQMRSELTDAVKKPQEKIAETGAEVMAEEEAIEELGDTDDDFKALKSKNPAAYDAIKAARAGKEKAPDGKERPISAEDVINDQLARINEDPAVVAAQRKLRAAEQARDNLNQYTIKIDDVRGSLELQRDKLHTAVSEATKNSTGSKEDLAAIKALTAARDEVDRVLGMPEASALRIQEALEGKGVKPVDKDKYGLAPELDELKRAQNAQRQAKEVAVDTERANVRAEQQKSADVIVNGRSIKKAKILDLNARVIAHADKKDKWKDDSTSLESRRLRIDTQVPQQRAAFLDGIIKNFETTDFRDLQPVFTEAVRRGNAPMIQAIMRRAMKEKMMGMVLREWSPGLITDADKDVPDAERSKGGLNAFSPLHRALLSEVEARQKRYPGDDGYKNLMSDGKIRLTDSAQAAKVFGKVVFQDMLGISRDAANEFMNSLSGIAFGNGEVPYMAMYAKDGRGVSENSTGLQAMVTRSILASAKGPAEMLRMLGEAQAFERDRNGNAVAINATTRELLKAAKETLRDERIVRANMTSGMLNTLSKFSGEVQQLLGAEHELVGMLKDVRVGRKPKKGTSQPQFY